MAKYSASATKTNGGLLPYYIQKVGSLYQVKTRHGGRVQMSTMHREFAVQWIDDSLPESLRNMLEN